MFSDKHYLGKIFICHASADKVFVRKIANALKKKEYSPWLDERELIVGDQLAERISSAVAEARVVLVVVSSASIKSKWLKFELNKATERMIHGQCRVIPVVKEHCELPPEVIGLLYSDFTSSFRYGMRSIFTALEHETSRSVQEQSFWVQAELALKKVFQVGFGFTDREYKNDDYEFICFPDLGDNTDILYETISNHLKSENPLNEIWWEEFYRHLLDRPLVERCVLLSERPVGFPIEKCSLEVSNIFIKRWKESRELHGWVVILDLSQIKNRALWPGLFKELEKVLVGLISEEKGGVSVK